MDFGSIDLPCLMGIVNVTPDSFSDTGRHFSAGAAVSHARRLIAEGAGILDVGAEASSFFRAGIVPVSAEEQLSRLVPVLKELEELGREVLISVDTRSAAVAQTVIGMGVKVINDVSGGTHEPELLRVVADSEAGIVLMSMSAGYPATPTADDADIVSTTRAALEAALQRGAQAGIKAWRMAVDPGVGFGKTMPDNWRLALRAREVVPAGSAAALVLGISRKRFLETPVPADVEKPAGWDAMVEKLTVVGGHARDAKSAALTAIAVRGGVGIHRVHDVRSARRGMVIAN